MIIPFALNLPTNLALVSDRYIRVFSKAISQFLSLVLLACSVVHAHVPGILSYQGRITVSNAPVTGTGQFKFALVNGSDGSILWSNDGISTSGSEPTASVSLTVSAGLYSVLLGANMTPVSPEAFDHPEVTGTVFPPLNAIYHSDLMGMVQHYSSAVAVSEFAMSPLTGGQPGYVLIQW